MDDPVQPDPGQGGESQSGSAPWADYLDRIPEDAREAASEAFKDWDAQTTRRFQDAAEYRKNWEPFEELGVNQRDPGDVEWGMQFVDALEDPQAIKQWYEEYAKQHNLTGQEQQEQPYVDPDTQSYLEQQFQGQLGPIAQQLADLAEWRQQQEQSAREQAAQANINSQLDALKSEDGFDRSKVEMFLPRHINADPDNAVRLAWEDYTSLRSQLQKEALQGKLDTPPAAEAGGVAGTFPEQPKTLAEARVQALEQLRATRGT